MEGGIYHAYARGNNRRLIYLDNRDRELYLQLLGMTTSGMEWNCLSYCLMDNHVHLLLETPCANLSAGMQRLQGDYAQAFNKRHNTVGHLFQGRYGAVRMLSDGQLWAAAAYLARNPVEAGMCKRAEDWRWSSYRHVSTDTGPPWLAAEKLLSYFGEQGAAARLAGLVEAVPPEC